MALTDDNRIVAVTDFRRCYSLEEIAKFSTKTLDDYSIVSRKQLDRIVNDSERNLTENEHRWLIKRDCRKVISNIKKIARRRTVSENVSREETNGMTYEDRGYATSTALPVDLGKTGGNYMFVENNLTVINVQQITIINVNNKSSNGGAHQHVQMIELDDADYNRDDNRERRRLLHGGWKYERPADHSAAKDLKRIYWNKWRAFVDGKRTSAGRCEMVDSFLSRIREKLNADRPPPPKSKRRSQPATIVRAAAPDDRQRATIETQRKLLEEQRTEIERLRVRQLQLESEKATLETERALQDVRHRGRRPVPAGTPERAPATVPAAASPADLVHRMEMRALDRRAKWEAVRERRRQAEREEGRRKRDLEEKTLREQMERKRERLFEAREKARLKREEERRRREERDAWLESVRAADEFRRRSMARRGLEAFRANLRDARSRKRDAADRYRRRTLGACLGEWRRLANDSVNEKTLSAQRFYERKLLTTTFLGFFKILEENKKKEQVAEDWHNLKVQEFCFKQWLDYTKKVNITITRKLLEADSYFNRIIIRRCFDNWRKFPEIVYKERLKDCRLRAWREKVQEILPDFVPPEF